MSICKFKAENIRRLFKKIINTENITWIKRVCQTERRNGQSKTWIGAGLWGDFSASKMA